MRNLTIIVLIIPTSRKACRDDCLTCPDKMLGVLMRGWTGVLSKMLGVLMRGWTGVLSKIASLRLAMTSVVCRYVALRHGSTPWHLADSERSAESHYTPSRSTVTPSKMLGV